MFIKKSEYEKLKEENEKLKNKIEAVEREKEEKEKGKHQVSGYCRGCKNLIEMAQGFGYSRYCALDRDCADFK